MYINPFFNYINVMDTTKLGAISGAIRAVASIIPGVLTKRVFKIAKLNFLDYAAVLT